MARDETARKSDRETSLLTRRNYLRFAGAAVASVATVGKGAADTTNGGLLVNEDFEEDDYDQLFSSTYVQGDLDHLTDAHAHSGSSCLEVEFVGGERGHGMHAMIDPKEAGLTDHNVQELYASYWLKFEEGFHGSRFMSKVSGPRFIEPVGPHAGEKTDGTNGWSALGGWTGDDNGEDPYAGQPIKFGYYAYHMDQPTRWGESPLPATLQPGEWYRIEQYCKLNTVSGGSTASERTANPDGVLALWVDGERMFHRDDMRFTLLPERGINYGVHAFFGGEMSSPKDQSLFYDDLVLYEGLPSDSERESFAHLNDDGGNDREPPAHTLEIVGPDDGTTTHYELSVTGDRLEDAEHSDYPVNSHDQIEGTTATGLVGSGGDAYAFDGDIDELTLDGPLGALRLNGESLDPDEYRTDIDAPHPEIDRFDISKSERLGDDRMFSVQWAVSSADEGLNTVEVVAAEGPSDLNFAVTDASGESASGWELFQFPIGTELDVNLRVTDAAENVTKETETITL